MSNIITGRPRIFTSNIYNTGVSGTTPVSKKTIEVELLTTGTTFSHSVGSQWTGAEVLIIDLVDMMALVNDIKAMYEAHRIDLTEHTGADNVNIITKADATDFYSTWDLAEDIMIQYIAHNADAELGSGWLYHTEKNASTHILSFGTIARTATAVIAALNEIKAKYNAHDNDGISHGTFADNQVTASDSAVVWNDSLYVPRQDPADVLNSAIIDSVVSDYARITFYF